MDLKEERNRIDDINSNIVEEVSERMDVVTEIAQKKEESDMDVQDSGREQKVIEQFRQEFDDRDMPAEKGEQLAEFLMSLARDYQRDRR